MSRHFVIVHDSDEECAGFYLGLPRWRCLFLDTDKAGELDFVYDYELKHARYEKVG